MRETAEGTTRTWKDLAAAAVLPKKHRRQIAAQIDTAARGTEA